MLELLGKPVARRNVVSVGVDGKRSSSSMLVWACAEDPCEPVCIARNPVMVDMSMSTIPDNGLWALEPCRRHASLFSGGGIE